MLVERRAVRLRRRHVVRRRLIDSPLARRLRVDKPTHAKVGRKGATAMNFALGPQEMLAARAEGRASRLDADLACTSPRWRWRSRAPGTAPATR